MDRRVVDALSTPSANANHNNPNNLTATTTATATATTPPTVETNTMPAMHLQTTTPSNHELPHGSPFEITPEDVETLTHSGGFAILRDHLAEHYNYDFCETHNDPLQIPHHTLHRDILHALLVPVIELYDKAESTAAHFTRSANPADHEYAYTASARAAFLWLQCFLDRERDWSYTRGCPGCVVSHTLDSEFTIRLLYAACLLSDVHYPFTLDGPTLPSFIFYLTSLRRALEVDELWGPGYFEGVAPKAAVTRNGIEELIHQCLELDAVLSAPTTPASNEALSPSISPVLAPMGGTPGMMRVKRSKMARQQQRLKVEEEKWVEEMMRCMNSLQLASLEVAASLDLNRPESLDSVGSLDSGVAIVGGGKGGERLAVVAVNEVVPVD